MPADSQNRKHNTPLIGLALGGGVARGWAHIGAIQRLEEIGVKPDVVCGTSVGALVGGVWLAGHLPALEEWARGLTKRRMLGYVDVMLNGSGLIGGKRLEKTLETYIDDLMIEELPAAFVAVAAELATGHETWIRKGSLVDAIQAAYALPGVFPPRAIHGRWVIDGALVNPLPVSVCRALGARIVIAVGLHADAFGRTISQRREQFGASSAEIDAIAQDANAGGAEKRMLRKLFKATGAAPGLGTTMIAAFNIVMDRMTRSRLAGDPPDVLIMPRVGHIPLLDFDQADALIELGKQAVDEHADEITSAMELLS
ncbi:MAG: patatin-like phospholipase family protein [Parvularculaceae bacterium]